MNTQGQNPRLLDQVRQVMRRHHYSLHTERSYLDWIKRFIHFHHVSTTMIYTHLLQPGGQGVPSPLDDL